MAKKATSPKKATETASGSTGDAAAADTAKDTAGASTAAPDSKAEVPEKDPLQLQYEEVDGQLGGLYDQLVAQIKAVAVDGTKGDSAEQMRAGAVQFLRQCNATLFSAQQLLEQCKSANEANNKQLQSIAAAGDALEKRSADYRRMTGGGQQTDAQ